MNEYFHLEAFCLFLLAFGIGAIALGQMIYGDGGIAATYLASVGMFGGAAVIRSMG